MRNEVRRIPAALWLIFWLFLSSLLFLGPGMSRTLNLETQPTLETVMVRISSPCHCHLSWDTCWQIHTYTDTHVRKWDTNSSPHTPWACTVTPVTTPVTCPYMSLCSVLTHTSAYSTWPPVTDQTWTCTIQGHVQPVQMAEVFICLMARKCAFTDFT